MSRVKELETELRIVYNELYVIGNAGSGFHARHNRQLKRYWEIVDELERISIKWKFKKIIRRLKKLWQRFS